MGNGWDIDVKILKLLLDNKEEKFSIKKVAERLKINYRIAYEHIVKVLEKEGLLKITRTGNSNICELTYNFNSKVYQAELLRRMKLFHNKNFLIIHNRLAELNSVFIALLFGSYAKGNADKHSDLDIMTIGGDEKEIKAVLSLLPDKIHLTQINYADFIHMAKNKEFTVVSEVLKNNIILVGIEEYYRLLKNAGCSKD